MVPNFTGRQAECEEIIDHVTSASTRMVSIWGSPGFGKTSVAIAVGHALQSQKLPVFFISLRGLQSKADLTSKLLSFVRPTVTSNQSSGQSLTLDDELCQIFTGIPDRCVFILDNADDLLESGLPKVKEGVVQLLEEILRLNEKVTFVVTTRESLEFMNLHFQGHRPLRIRPLDEGSSKFLVYELLPNASTSDCSRITQICGHVPLAIKLLCSLISEDNAQPSHFLDDFLVSSTGSIAEMLDNPDYPTDHRLQFLFDSSFQRLSSKEKEALVSLCILPESFNIEVAAAVLGEKRIFEAKKILQSLRRKSLLDSRSTSESFTMHKLLQSFARERGEQHMNETLLNSKVRLRAFYVSLFEKLNEQFLTGHSMLAFISFYEDEQSIVQSLIEGCSDSKIAESAFNVLVKAELFLATLFYVEGHTFYKIYDSAIEAAKKLGAIEFYCRLLVSKALSEVTWGAEGNTKHLLSKAKEILESTPESSFSTFKEEIGKSMCYSGISQLVAKKIESGVECLKRSLVLMNDSHEQAILKLLMFQILTVYYQFLNNSASSAYFYSKAIQQCREAGDIELLVIPPLESKEKKNANESQPYRGTDILLNQPLKLAIIFLIAEATNSFPDTDTTQSLSNVALQILREVETEVPVSLGLLNVHRNASRFLTTFNQVVQDPVKMYEARISYHQKTLKQCNDRKESSAQQEESSASFYQVHIEALAKCYLDLGKFQYSKKNYPEALQPLQRALDITHEVFGEEHASTADSYNELGNTQIQVDDLPSALHSHQRALVIRLKLFGEEHARTAGSYHELGNTQYQVDDLPSALHSHQRALVIRLKLFGEEHASTADSYHSLGCTQYQLCDFASALQSDQRALDIRLKLLGEEHASTADSYDSLGCTQHQLGDLTSALQLKQCALDIRLKLFGEEHARTAVSYHSLGCTQYQLGDLPSALHSHQRAMDIRLKLFGEEHASTADSYHELGVTQHQLGDLTSALQLKQCALDIRLKLFGEEHASTADSYRELGITQHQLGDFTSALHSHQSVLDIRLKLFGEEHPRTADSYRDLGIRQHELGDLTSALHSHQRALDVCLKLFGEENASTADSYRDLGITQRQLGDFTSALHSHQSALDIRLKLFGEEHASTADSYRELGITQRTDSNVRTTNGHTLRLHPQTQKFEPPRTTH